MKVAIINTPRNGVEVHGADCADVKKSATRNNDDAWIIEVESRLGLSHTYWVDQISDEVDPFSAEGWATAALWMGEFRFLPCCKDLPQGESPFVAEGVAADPEPVAAAALTSCWIGYKVADRIMHVRRPATISAKLDAAKPTKCADRTVRLTADEVVELRAFCTELEGEAGMMAYSARSLRKRLS